MVLGGELFALLEQREKFDVQTARFYAANVCSACVYFHNINLVFRDLKPENLMLDQHGHCMLIDFGEQSTNNLPRTTDHQPPAFVMDASRPLL